MKVKDMIDDIEDCERLQWLNPFSLEQESELFRVTGQVWKTVVFHWNGHRVQMEVSRLPLAIDGMMANVTAEEAELLDAHFGHAPMTPRLADRIKQAGTMVVTPQVQPWDGKERRLRGYSAAMDDHGANVRSDRDIKHTITTLADLGGDPSLVVGCFKWWVATVKKRTHHVANYGFYGGEGAGTLPGIKLIQTLMFGHFPTHTDYSQFYRGIRNEFHITFPDGSEGCYLFEELAMHPDLHPIVTHEGQQIPTMLPTDGLLPVPAVTIERDMRIGMIGEDVKAWQQTMRIYADGVFGPQTEAATKSFQTAHGLVNSGVVNYKTRVAADNNDKVKSDQWSSSVDINNLPFVEATNYTRSHTRGNWEIKQIIIHDMEAPEGSLTAEAVARYFASGERAPRASAHLNIDNDSIVQSVQFDKIAWHAPKMNRIGIGIEHAGYARQSKAEWLDDYSMSMLWLSAQAAAQLCQRYNIPPRWLTDEQLVAGEPGFATHAQGTRAFSIAGGHGDPGKNFPYDEYMAMVVRAMGMR